MTQGRDRDDDATEPVNRALEDGDHAPADLRKADGRRERDPGTLSEATDAPPEGAAAGDEQAGRPPRSGQASGDR